MLTMQPVLQVGAYEFAPGPFGREEFDARLDRLRALMTDNGWSHLLVYGSIPDHASLAYLTNFTPRLAPAMALVPLAGEVSLLTFVGGRMVDAAGTTTWVEDVKPVKNLAETLQSWLDATPGSGQVALAEFDNLPAGLFERAASLTPIAEGADATSALRDLRRAKSPVEIGLIEQACAILAAGTEAMRGGIAAGIDASECLLAAETAALEAGAQDIRTLFSPDGGPALRPMQQLSERPSDAMTAYLAVRYRGYWAAGFISATGGDLAGNALAAMIGLARPGTRAADLLAMRDRILGGHDRHPLTATLPAAGIGLALEESPRLAVNSTDTLETGDVCAFQAGCRAPDGNYVLASAIAAIEADGARVLWQSAS